LVGGVPAFWVNVQSKLYFEKLSRRLIKIDAVYVSCRRIFISLIPISRLSLSLLPLSLHFVFPPVVQALMLRLEISVAKDLEAAVLLWTLTGNSDTGTFF
jgi:hypothetical protein